jgi:hypothetical protein
MNFSSNLKNVNSYSLQIDEPQQHVVSVIRHDSTWSVVLKTARAATKTARYIFTWAYAICLLVLSLYLIAFLTGEIVSPSQGPGASNLAEDSNEHDKESKYAENYLPFTRAILYYIALVMTFFLCVFGLVITVNIGDAARSNIGVDKFTNISHGYINICVIVSIVILVCKADEYYIDDISNTCLLLSILVVFQMFGLFLFMRSPLN